MGQGYRSVPPVPSRRTRKLLDVNDGDQRVTRLRSRFEDVNDRRKGSSDRLQMSVSESLKLRPRKRMRSHRPSSSGEGADFNEDHREPMTPPEGPVADRWEPNEEYEVEAIRDIRTQNGTLCVCVKWKNWPESTNSWEPFSNTRCYDAITEFLEIRDDTKYMPLVIHEYVREKFRYPEANIFIVCKLLDTGFSLKQCLLLDYREKLRLTELLRLTKRGSLLRRIKKHYGKPLVFVRLVDAQQNLRSALEEYQREFTAELRQEAPIYFENLIDSESAPVSFTVIEDYSFAAGISPRENEQSCKCLDCETCTCANFPTTLGQNYTLDGRLTQAARIGESAIFECGSRCCCAVDCYNKVTQRGRPVEVTVYKTGTRKGWGLRTNSSIRAWTFVLEYLGVVKRYFCVPNEDDFPYVFELKVDGQQRASFVIDSTQRGNISRFINHSCNPNLIALRVFNQNADPEMPRIALFACRDIAENEELTFDYRTMKVARSSRSRGFSFECCCEETNCLRELMMR